MPSRLFIIGMYKSGTSWLLSALSAHPCAAGIREFDILKGVTVKTEDGSPKLKPIAARINKVFGGNSWCAVSSDLQKPNAINAYMTEVEKTQFPVARYLGDLPAETAIEILGRILEAQRAEKSDSKPEERIQGREFFGRMNEADFNTPLSCHVFSADNLTKMFLRVANAKDVFTAADAYVDGIESELENVDYVVYKAADQINRFEILVKWQPDSRKVIIVRDGRDSAISASHYKRLMKSQDRPWLKNLFDPDSNGKVERHWLRELVIRALTILFGEDKVRYFRSLRTWARRIDILMENKNRKELYILRYEDLRTNFDKEFSALLDWLGWDSSPELVREIRERTNFENIVENKLDKGGYSLLRKGKVLEWVDELGFIDKLIAWQLAGKQLSRMGYRRTGTIEVFNRAKPSSD